MTDPRNSHHTTQREATDAALIAERNAAAQDALEAALATFAVLKEANAALQRAQATVDQARRNHAEASAKVLQFQLISRAAA